MGVGLKFCWGDGWPDLRKGFDALVFCLGVVLLFHRVWAAVKVCQVSWAKGLFCFGCHCQADPVFRVHHHLLDTLFLRAARFFPD